MEKHYRKRAASDLGAVHVLDRADVADMPPHSQEAEEYLLSSLFVGGADALAKCVQARLTPAAFYMAPHRMLFEAMLGVQRKGFGVDVATVAEDLRMAGKLDLVGGYAFLAKVSSRVPTSMQVGFFIEKVLHLWLLRVTLKRLQRSVSSIREWNGTDNVPGLLGAIAHGTGKPALFARAMNDASAADAATQAEAHLQAMAAGTAPTPDRIITGIPDFDLKLYPFDPINEDFLVILMAPPSVGKSSLARNIVGANLPRNKKLMVFLLETGRQRYLQMLAAEMAKVNINRLADTPRDKIERLERAMGAVKGFYQRNLFVDDELYFIEDIEARSHALSDRHGGLDGIVVDYAQLVKTRTRHGNREQAVAEISSKLKALGKSLRCPVFALAQMNNEAIKAKRVPQLTDLRESGALGADADRVIGIYRPEKDSRDIEQTDNQMVYEQWLCQVKFRNGPTGYVKTWFDRRYTRYQPFREREELK